MASLKCGEIDDRPKIRQIFTYIESHVSIEQIDRKMFLGDVPNKFQPGYHRSPLIAMHGLWIVRISRFSNYKSASAKGLSHNYRSVLMVALNHRIYTKRVNCHFT